MEERKFNSGKSNHNIIVEDRERVSISGVENVESFDEDKIVVETTEGSLTLEGENMHINSLSVDDGEVIIEGFVFSVVYGEEQDGNSGGFFSKLFK